MRRTLLAVAIIAITQTAHAGFFMVENAPSSEQPASHSIEKKVSFKTSGMSVNDVLMVMYPEYHVLGDLTYKNKTVALSLQNASFDQVRDVFSEQGVELLLNVDAKTIRVDHASERRWDVKKHTSTIAEKKLTPVRVKSAQSWVMDDSQYFSLVGKNKPIESMRYANDSIHLVLASGYEIVSAKNKDNNNLYRGKVNKEHVITTAKLSDDVMTIVLSNKKNQRKYIRLTSLEKSIEVDSQQETATSLVAVEPIGGGLGNANVAPTKGYLLNLQKGQYLSNELDVYLTTNFSWSVQWDKPTDVVVLDSMAHHFKDVTALANWLYETANLKVILDVQNKKLIIQG